MKKLLLIASIFLLLSACASPYPLGMDEKQWNSLTAGERKALLLKQQQQRAAQRLVQIKADARARELRIKQEMLETKRLEKLYANPRDGNVLIVNLLGGELHQGKRQKRILEASYQIALGETKKIKISLEDKKKHYTTSETAYLTYDQNGNGVYLYLDNPNYSHNRRRVALLRDGHWRCGSNYTKSLHGSYEKLVGVQVFVKEKGERCHSRHAPNRYESRDDQNYRRY
ncbi:MAG: hypothetical protein GXO35_00920 [Gammaproteobacteria bacterium]|nr:hypothetical protein [Gammaproteobacteria bacterium]